MKSIKYENIVNFLVNEFPEFKETEDYQSFDKDDLGLPYIVWGAFAKYVVARVEKNGGEDAVAQRLFSFVNDQFNNPESDPKVIDLLIVEVFENFAQTKSGLEFSRRNTRGKARSAVEESLAFTGVDEPIKN